MRSFIVMAMFTSSLAFGSWNGYTEVRDLEIEAANANRFVIDAGPGSLTVQGVDDSASIRVTAEIGVDTRDEEKAAKFIEKNMTLTLERNGDSVRLVSDVDNGWGRDSEGWIKLVVEMPATLALDIDDGSGSIAVGDLRAAVRIDDGSGSIKIHGAGAIEIDDGSGSIDIEQAGGDVSIIDGSGSIDVRGVAGSVTVDDGSGSIRISDVEHDVIIEDSGSGGVTLSDVRGSVETDDG